MTIDLLFCSAVAFVFVLYIVVCFVDGLVNGWEKNEHEWLASFLKTSTRDVGMIKKSTYYSGNQAELCWWRTALVAAHIAYNIAETCQKYF